MESQQFLLTKNANSTVRKPNGSLKLFELIIKHVNFQPMIQYINHKDIYGPFSKKADVYLPHSAEVTSAKYTNM